MRFLCLLGLASLHFVVHSQTAPVVNTRTASGYPSIQQAVDAAEEGDTLTLASVTFEERVVIDKAVALLGQSGGGTVLDIRNRPSYGIHLVSGGSTLENLTVISSSTHVGYAIHSEPGISGLTLRNIAVLNNATSGIDLNGLEPEAVNTIESCSAFNCGAGFGLALSSCQNVQVDHFNSFGNGNGDIGILESAYTQNRTEDIRFSGELNLLGVNGDGLGAIVVQADSTIVNPGVGLQFDIDMQSNFIHKLTAMTEYDGAPLGFLLCTTENVAALTEALSSIPGVTGLVARNIASGALEVWPGMLLQDAIEMAEVGEAIQVLQPGDYDTEMITVDRPLTILGPNAGLDATDPARIEEARFLGGMTLAASNVTVDGIRLQSVGYDGDGLTLSAGATDITVRNTVIRGSFDVTGDMGQAGTRNHGEVSFERCSWRNWPVGIALEQGALSVAHSTVSDNGEGVRFASNGTGTTRLEAGNLIMVNAGVDAFAIESAHPGDSLIVTETAGTLHRHAFRFDEDIDHRIEGNVFVESEDQVVGLSNGQRIPLCEQNEFFLPPINIEGCMDPLAPNYEACATLDPGVCNYGGCTDPGACNFDGEATLDNGSCEYQTCAGCLNAEACNYDPEATAEGSCDFESCRGCTDPAALNYDPGATIDDGSCRIAGCMNPEADNYNPDATFDNGVCFFFGCTDPTACNFDAQANLDVGTCDFDSCAGCTAVRACNYDPTASVDDGSCDYVSCRGCTNPDAVNYNPDATLDDGSCRILGCTDAAAVNYDAEATTNDGSCEFAGCTDSGACNFDAAADVDDGSCDYTACAGCAVAGFCNYDPTATVHDGSLCDYLSCCGDPAATNYDPAIFPQLTFGCVYGQAAGQASFMTCTLPFACNFGAAGDCEFDSCAGCTEPAACNYDPTATLSTTTCTGPADLYGVDYVDCAGSCLNDVNGNGVCDEEETTGCTDSGACNYSASATLDDGGCEFVSCAGCTDNAACNFEAGTLLNDGSCEYESCAGCLDATACNYDGAATVSGSCVYPVDLFGVNHVDCQGDCLQDADGDGICDEAEVPGCTNLAACNYSSEATENNGSCDFSSCYGCTDATACNYDPSVTELDDSCDYITCAGCTDPDACDFDAEATISLVCTYPADSELDCAGNCLVDADSDGVCDVLEVSGCTEVTACNFNVEATDDDGSCEFLTCAGCTNPGACNFMAAATLNDGSCDYSECQGCTDANACNYAIDATAEDGSCIYPLDIWNDPALDCGGFCLSDTDGDGTCDLDEIRGCMEPGACNYDPLAEFDDESCEYQSCAGCTLEDACNYNALATLDDGSCSTPVSLYGSDAYDCLGTCLEDADGDGVCDAFEVVGCQDELACNYDPAATDAADCQYPAEYYDCDNVCLNDADGDGVCDELEVVGCSDPTACNYEPAATDPGLCEYPAFDYVDCDGICLEDSDGDGICDPVDEGDPCLGDLNEDGLRSASDVLILLTGYGCLSDCGELDLNGDGKVTAADILSMLTVFGSYCP